MNYWNMPYGSRFMKWLWEEDESVRGSALYADPRALLTPVPFE
jgi:hypothetical protein